MLYTLPRLLAMIKANSSSILLRPEFFQTQYSGAIRKDVTGVGPILKFPDGVVKLKYNVGTRGNGVDQPRWPEDLKTEIVT